MAVNITWGSTNANAAAGTGITEPLDHGSGGSGTTLTAQDVYLAHDGNYQITNCKFYLGEYSDTYSGSFLAATDLAELLEWGDEAAEDDFGGFQINMDAIGSFATAWPTYDSKGTLTGVVAAFRTGTGDSAADGVNLHVNMATGMSIAGTIPANMTTWPHFQVRMQIPTNEGTTGTRQFDQKLRFTYTS